MYLSEIQSHWTLTKITNISNITLYTRIVVIKSRRQKSWSNGEPEIFSAALFLIKAFIDTNAFSIKSNRTVHKGTACAEGNLLKYVDSPVREGHTCNYLQYLKLLDLEENKTKSNLQLCNSWSIHCLLSPKILYAEIWKIIFIKILFTSDVLLPFSFFALVFDPHGVLQL